MSHQFKKDCKENWDKMTPIENSDNRYCHKCAMIIHDLTGLSDEAVAALKNSPERPVCVRQNIRPNYKLHYIKPNLGFNNSLTKGIGIMGLFFMGAFSNSSFAQNINNGQKPQIVLTDTSTEMITIKGITTKKTRLGFRKGVQSTLEIRNADGLVVKTIETSKHGRFKIEIPKNILGENYIISAYKNYLYADLYSLEPKSGKFNILLEETIIRVGYF